MDASTRLTTLTRLGFAARGLLYVVIALLLIRMGRAEDPIGALDYLAEDGGRLLLGLMAGGFAAYGIWRMADALLNIERHEDGGKGVTKRLGAGGSGVVHLLLAWQAVRIVQGGSAGSGSSQAGAESTLSLPGGHLLLIIGGAVLMAVALFQFITAAKASYLRHLESRVANRPWALWTGRAGYGARGLVFLISGFFLLRAGLDREPARAGGMQEALSWLTSPWDVLVAAGLFGFGLYSLIEARFRIIHDVPVGHGFQG